MATQGPKAARGDEIRSAIQLKQSVFSADGARIVRERLPAPAPDEVWEHLRVIVDGERVVSVLSMSYREIVLLGTRHVACCFGGVCTDPGYRGNGLATQLLEASRRKAVADGADLVLISGRRGLYRNQGYVPVGPFQVCTVSRERLPADGVCCTLRAARDDDLPGIMQMSLGEPARFVRTPQEMARLVRRPRVLNAMGRTQVVCIGPDGPAAAYVSYQIGATPWERGIPPNAIRVVEFAGSRWAILHALAGLMDAYGVDSLELHSAQGDVEVSAIAHDLGWPCEPRPFRGTVGIINPEAFWQACAPLFRDRLGDEAFGRLSFECADGGVRIRYGSEGLPLPDMESLTRIVFTHPARRRELEPGPRPGSDLAGVLDALFPLPLVNYGLTYH